MVGGALRGAPCHPGVPSKSRRPPPTTPGRRPAVFVHQSSVQSNGFRFLKDGERVSRWAGPESATTSDIADPRTVSVTGVGPRWVGVDLVSLLGIAGAAQ